MSPSRPNLRARLHAGETLFGAFLNLGSPLAAELCARAGFDWLIVDLEHGAATEADLLEHLYAIGGTGASAIVRPASGERLRIGRALDFGADGIMVPRIDTADEAREAVSYLRWPPDGARGLALLTRGAELGEVAHGSVSALNQRVVGVVQVESPAAVAAAAEIATIDGVDVLFVGPTDLSHSMGIPGQFDDPAFGEALRTVVAATDAAGKAAGILLRDARSLASHVELGFRFIGLGSDAAFVADGARAVLGAARA
ncbi:MAG TPA: aldolase/citrate lyase family protein [Candidatus Angelobacter sp.]|nr:aldolase/citrate lyase family protein [Candidatus Angelobacter sp.]